MEDGLAPVAKSLPSEIKERAPREAVRCARRRSGVFATKAMLAGSSSTCAGGL